MSGSYPRNGEITCAERVARWRPLVNWILVIPLYLWLTVLGYGAAVVSLAGWFAMLFTGRLPELLGDYLVAVLRYRWRVVASLLRKIVGPACNLRHYLAHLFTVRSC